MFPLLCTTEVASGVGRESPELLAVVCADQGGQKLIDELLTSSSTESTSGQCFHLITRKDINSTALEPIDSPMIHVGPDSVFEHSTDETAGMDFVTEVVAHHPELDGSIVCVLDHHTLTNRSCLLLSKSDWSPNRSNDEKSCYVRSDFSHALKSTADFTSGRKTRSQLANEAALNGGAIGATHPRGVSDIKSATTRELMQGLTEQEVSEDWAEHSGVLIPLFCTVEVPTEVGSRV